MSTNLMWRGVGSYSHLLIYRPHSFANNPHFGGSFKGSGYLKKNFGNVLLFYNLPEIETDLPEIETALPEIEIMSEDESRFAAGGLDF